MQGTVQQFLAGIASYKDQQSLFGILAPMSDRYSSCALSSAGLVIKAGSSALAKTGTAVTVLVASGVLLQIAGSTDMPALTGIDIAQNDFNVVCFFVDRGGTVTAAAGTAGADLKDVLFPVFPQGQALVGFLMIDATSAFTGGSTALDAVTTTYCSPTGAFDPNVLVGATNY